MAKASEARRNTEQMVTDEGSFDTDDEEEMALQEAEAEARAALARIHGSGGGARLSSRPTDVPVTRFEDDPDFVDWELAESYSKKPWQERLRIAEEKRALKALAWEEEVRARAAAKMERQRQVAEAEAELERLQKRRADILVRQRHKKAMANTKVDPKAVPRSRTPWGYTGSPGTVDNIIRSSPGIGRAFGRSYPSPSSSYSYSHSGGSGGHWGNKENASPGGYAAAAPIPAASGDGGGGHRTPGAQLAAAETAENRVITINPPCRRPRRKRLAVAGRRVVRRSVHRGPVAPPGRLLFSPPRHRPRDPRLRSTSIRQTRRGRLRGA